MKAKTSWVVLLMLVVGAITEGGTTMKLTSSSFENGHAIPARFAGEGADVSPSLKWEGAPAATLRCCGGRLPVIRWCP